MRCLEEASEIQTGSQLRQLFATILLFCTPSQPELLWNRFRDRICERLAPSITRLGHQNPTVEDEIDYGLHLLNNILMQSQKTLLNYPNMPLPRRDWGRESENHLIAEQLNYNPDDERQAALTRISSLNVEQ
ncbi:hypothetical protein K435DRAFT_670588, partial [Dendrothele bispora CBS 962.96]